MRKIVITLIGGLITLVGVVFILLPGPAWLVLPIGLAILSLEYTWARAWLKKAQRYMSTTARWLDNKLYQLKH